MVIYNYHWLNSASRVLISTCSAPVVQTGEHKQFSLFDLDLWLTILTYNPRLAKVKVDPHAKSQGQRSNSSHRRVPTDKRTHTHTHGRYKRINSPAAWLIIKFLSSTWKVITKLLCILLASMWLGCLHKELCCCIQTTEVRKSTQHTQRPAKCRCFVLQVYYDSHTVHYVSGQDTS